MRSYALTWCFSIRRRKQSSTTSTRSATRRFPRRRPRPPAPSAGRGCSRRRSRSRKSARSTRAASRRACTGRRPDEGLGLLVYFHGGGWVVGDLDTHDATCRGLAVSSGHAVLSVDYRLAPEHPFPAPLDDALSATRLGVRERRGARLRSRPARGRWRLRRRQPRRASSRSAAAVPLRFQLLVYPIADARCGTASYEEFADGPFLTRPSMDWFIGHYLSGGAGAADDPRVSPLLAAGRGACRLSTDARPHRRRGRAPRRGRGVRVTARRASACPTSTAATRACSTASSRCRRCSTSVVRRWRSQAAGSRGALELGQAEPRFASR